MEQNSPADHRTADVCQWCPGYSLELELEMQLQTPLKHIKVELLLLDLWTHGVHILLLLIANLYSRPLRPGLPLRLPSSFIFICWSDAPDPVACCWDQLHCFCVGSNDDIQTMASLNTRTHTFLRCSFYAKDIDLPVLFRFTVAGRKQRVMSTSPRGQKEDRQIFTAMYCIPKQWASFLFIRVPELRRDHFRRNNYK